MPKISDCYVRVSFFIETPPDMQMDSCEVAIQPLTWSRHVVPRELVRCACNGNKWCGEARWPKNSKVSYIIVVIERGGVYSVKTRESLFRQVRLREANVVIRLNYNDRRNVHVFVEWRSPKLPGNPIFLLHGRDMEKSIPTDPNEQLVTAQRRHIQRRLRQARAVRRRRLPRAIRRQANTNGDEEDHQMSSINVDTNQPQIANEVQINNLDRRIHLRQFEMVDRGQHGELIQNESIGGVQDFHVHVGQNQILDVHIDQNKNFDPIENICQNHHIGYFQMTGSIMLIGYIEFVGQIEHVGRTENEEQACLFKINVGRMGWLYIDRMRNVRVRQMRNKRKGRRKNVVKSNGDLIKQGLKNSLLGLAVGAVVGLAGWAWCKWKT